MLGKVWYFETPRSNCITSWKLFSVLSKPIVYKQFRIFWETQWHQWNSLNNRNSFQVRRKGKKTFKISWNSFQTQIKINLFWLSSFERDLINIYQFEFWSWVWRHLHFPSLLFLRLLCLLLTLQLAAPSDSGLFLLASFLICL